jgi:hypothetical protein
MKSYKLQDTSCKLQDTSCKQFKIQNSKFKILILILFIVHCSLFTQSFSVLTCSRGEEIYSTFGHSAIRYQDSAQKIDWVYNYGLFEFSDPNFIPKFCMGKLDYMVGKETMNDFMGQYVYQQRFVSEQILNLTTAQRDSLFRFLEWNILPENKYYRYDFLFNNCATKIIEVLEKNCNIRFTYYKDPAPKSFRQLIHINAENSVPWIDWGMDLALGMPTDIKANPKQYCFLPEYIEKTIELSKISSKSNLIIGGSRFDCLDFYFKPFFFSCLLVLIFIFHKFKPQSWSRIIIGNLFIILGIGGLVIGFEWFMTEHTVTKMNWNLVWLNPLSLIFGIQILRNKINFKLQNIIGFTSILSLIAAIFGFQEFHTASIVLMICVFLFYSVHFHLFRKIKSKPVPH